MRRHYDGDVLLRALQELRGLVETSVVHLAPAPAVAPIAITSSSAPPPPCDPRVRTAVADTLARLQPAHLQVNLRHDTVAKARRDVAAALGAPFGYAEAMAEALSIHTTLKTSHACAARVPSQVRVARYAVHERVGHATQCMHGPGGVQAERSNRGWDRFVCSRGGWEARRTASQPIWRRSSSR